MRALAIAALLTAAGCGHQRARPAQAEARAWHYRDSSGLLVGTYAGWLRHRLPAGLSGEVKAVADYVRLDRDRGFDPTAPGADRRAPDAVTSASATAGGGAVAEEWRLEGQAALDVERAPAGVPVTVGAVARRSTEPDYRSLSGAVRAAAEPFERSTLLAVQLAYGVDRVDPVEVPRGQEAVWPATHRRWALTLTVAQLLSPRLVLDAALAATWQRGVLSSPYRRAVVAPNLLLPETLPRARDRYSGHLGLSLSLSRRLALHLRQGAYADSWSVEALVPSAAVAAEVADDVVIQVGYRHYRQTRASFYRTTYPEPAPVMTGDLRLGSVRDHAFALDLWRPPLVAGYELSAQDFRGVGARVVAHVFQIGLGAAY